MLVTVSIGPLIVSKSGDRSRPKVQFPTFSPNEDSHWQIVAALELDHVEHDDHQRKCGTLVRPNAFTSKPVHPKTTINRNCGMF